MSLLEKIQKVSSELENSKKLSEELKSNFYLFFKHFWQYLSPEEFVDSFHIKIMCDTLKKEGFRIKERQSQEYDAIIFNVPPGSTKTITVLNMFPVWVWTIDPTIRIISSSHSIGLSKKAAVASRDLIRTEEYKRLFPYVKIKGDFDTQTEYKNTIGGVRQATSPDSKIIGDHAHILLYDDLIDPKGVGSAVKLPGVIQWLDQTIAQREVNKLITSHIMIMQRLGIGDPTDHFLNTRKNVLHIKLPAASDVILSDGTRLMGDVQPPFLRTKYKNGLLDPNRLPLSVIEKKMATLTQNDFNAQFQQDTETDSGKIIQKEYVEIIESYDLPDGFWTKAIMYAFVDSAQTTKKENDPTGILIATKYNGYLYLVDYYSERMAFSALIDRLISIFNKHGTSESAMFIEPKSNGKDIVDYLTTHTKINVVEWEMLSGGKLERINIVEPSVRSRGIKVIKGDWNNNFLRTLYNFPDPSIIHDEEVDVFVMAAAESYLDGRNFVRNVISYKY